ncbi:MAG: capsule assembly Wzi family protein [bacterium]|nr:capsule assembly Wzi family protein [bacterium]
MKRIIILGFITILSVDFSHAVYLSCDDWAGKGTPDWSYRYLEYLLVRNPGAGELFLSAMPLGTEDCFEYASEYSGTGRAEYYYGAIKDKARPSMGNHPRIFERKFDDNIAVSAGGHIQFRAAYGNNDQPGEDNDVSGFDGYGRLGIISDVHFGDRISIRKRIDIVRPFGDELDGIEPYRRREDDANQPATGYIEWADTLGKMNEAYIDIDLTYFHLQLGRDNVRWGPGYYTALTVSDNPPSFDMVKLYSDIGPVRLTCFTSILDGKEEKFLSAHRVDWRIYDRLYLGASEVILYAGQGIQPKYLNPLTIYYAEQWNSHDQDNYFVSLDGRFIPFNGYELYGEVSIDDYQYQSFPGGAPNKVGYLGGFYGAGILSENLDVRAEYCRINRWMYTHRYSRNRYTHYQDTIGSWLGPDAFYARGEVSYNIMPALRVFIGGGTEQRGEGTIDEPWELSGSDLNNPEEDRIDGKSNPFPSGTVEKTMFFRGGAEGINIWKDLTLYGEGYYAKTDNAGNVADAESSLWYAGLDLRWGY